MEKTKKNDDQIIKILDVKVIRRLICQTDKGPLELVIRKGENNYFLAIDATPLEKEMNDKLMDILFKPEIPPIKKYTGFDPITKEEMESIKPIQITIKKKGRPAKK